MKKKNGRHASKPNAVPSQDPNIMPDITGPGGVPTLYKPEYDKMLVEHMDSGLSFESFAGVVDVSAPTLYAWAKVNASFHNAHRVGKEKLRLFYEKMGVYYMVEGRRVEIKNSKGKVTGYTKSTEKLNANIYRLNMINRFGWKNSGAEEADAGDEPQQNLALALVEAIEAKRVRKKS